MKTDMTLFQQPGCRAARKYWNNLKQRLKKETSHNKKSGKSP